MEYWRRKKILNNREIDISKFNLANKVSKQIGMVSKLQGQKVKYVTKREEKVLNLLNPWQFLKNRSMLLIWMQAENLLIKIQEY